MKRGDKFMWKNPSTGKYYVATVNSSLEFMHNCRAITVPELGNYSFPVPEDDLVPITVFKSPLFKTLNEIDSTDS